MNDFDLLYELLKEEKKETASRNINLLKGRRWSGCF